MKLIQTEIKETDLIGDEEEVINAKIDTENISHIFSMLSNIYSNPINSIVRELTSNCFDSHSMTETDKAVIVGFDEEDYNEYVFFQDFGTGLNPDQMRNIYMSYGTSTKRNTNKALGLFGIGSKSPFSYTDEFYIETIVSNIKYEYLMFKDEYNNPKLTLLTENKTEDINGTKIKIYLKEHFDKYNFTKAFKDELLYFDNVYFKDNILENNYTIYEWDTFKYRKENDRFSVPHIVYGKVAYPIRNDILVECGLTSFNTFAIKFEIGELEVTPSREEIKYTSSQIEFIKKRLEEFKKNLLSKILWKIYNNYQEYYIYKNKIEISLGEENLKIEDRDWIENKNNYIIFNKYNIKPNGIPKLDEILNLLCYCDYKLYNGRKTKYKIRPDLKTNEILYRIKDYSNTSSIKNKLISNAYLIRLKKLKKFQIYTDLVYFFGLKKNPKRLYIVRDIYRSLFKEIICLTKSYDKLEVPKEKILEIEEAKKIQRSKEEFVIFDRTYFKKIDRKHYYTFEQISKKKGLIVLCDDEFYSDKIYDVFSDNNLYKSVWYCSKRTYNKLKDLDNIITYDKFMKGDNIYFKRIATCILIRDLVKKVFDNIILKGGLNAKNDLKNKYRDDYIYTKYLDKECLKNTRNNYILNLCNEEISENLLDLKKYYDKNNKNLDKEFEEEIIEIAKKHGYFDNFIIHKFNRCSEYFEGIELIFNIAPTNEAIQQFVEYARFKKKKLGKAFYNILTEKWELELIKENFIKINYKNQINGNIIEKQSVA